MTQVRTDVMSEAVIRLEDTTPDRHYNFSELSEHAKLAKALSHFLASTYVLYHKSLLYHWNVIGPHFVGLHQLFEQHYEDLHKAGDVIAERIRAIGYMVPGTLAAFLQASSIEEDKEFPHSEAAMVSNLLQAHEICTKEAQHVFEISEEAKDAATSDLMVARIAFHDKAAWMLRSLQV